MYDSRPDTYKHKIRVIEIMHEITCQLEYRALTHDNTKLVDPELKTFNEFTPKLKDSTYGSDEYKNYLAEMGVGLTHHYENNRHHPEHFANGVNGMTIIDLLEMLVDWKAATERHADGNFKNSLAIQRSRFELSDQLYDILVNTAKELGWI